MKMKMFCCDNVRSSCRKEEKIIIRNDSLIGLQKNDSKAQLVSFQKQFKLFLSVANFTFNRENLHIECQFLGHERASSDPKIGTKDDFSPRIFKSSQVLK